MKYVYDGLHNGWFIARIIRDARCPQLATVVATFGSLAQHVLPSFICVYATQELPAGIQILKPPHNDLMPMVLSVINGNDYINYRCARTAYHLYFVYFVKRSALYTGIGKIIKACGIRAV